MNIARRFAQEWRQVVVLKGANTLVANPEGRLYVNPIATPALARAGTGDVLAGIITGLLAQGVPPFEAAYASAWLHGMSGLMAEKTIGNSASVLAGDVIDGFIRVMGTLDASEVLIRIAMPA
jgi:NAD(P)H-hydrate epimerase